MKNILIKTEKAYKLALKELESLMDKGENDTSKYTLLAKCIKKECQAEPRKNAVIITR